MRIFAYIYNVNNIHYSKCAGANSKCRSRHLSTENRDCPGVGVEGLLEYRHVTTGPTVAPGLSTCRLNVRKVSFVLRLVES